MLEFVPEHFKVIRHVRPKYVCACCAKIVQRPAPSRPIAQGVAGPGLLARVLVSKFCDHLPLYRQAQIYARAGVELERSTLADWVGESAALLDPLVRALGKHVVAGEKLHADDTPMPVLQPGRGTDQDGTAVDLRSGRSTRGGAGATAVWFRYSPDREREHPGEHLKEFSGILQADAYAGFNGLYQERGGKPPLIEAACWVTCAASSTTCTRPATRRRPRRRSSVSGNSTAVEDRIRGRPPDQRREYRQEHAAPLLASLHDWMHATLAKTSTKSELARAIRYGLTLWKALTRYVGTMAASRSTTTRPSASCARPHWAEELPVPGLGRGWRACRRDLQPDRHGKAQ